MFEAYVYLLRCCDDSLYCGWTNDPVNRLKTHNSGKGAKYTQLRLPVEMVYLEGCENKREALKRELTIKHISRQLKLELLVSEKNLLKQLVYTLVEAI
jgi:putative endonuclease